MQSHELENIGKTKKKRIARGGKRGTTSGRGTKGQKARSGGNVNPLFEGGRSSLTQRMKKLRGFKSPHPKKNVVTLAELDAKYVDGEVVSVETLRTKNIIRKKTVSYGVRIVATGTCSKKLSIDEGILMSEAAQKALGVAKKTEKSAKPVEKKETAKTPKAEKDDLTKIEGIGPKIAELFATNSITTYAELADADVKKLATLLEENKLGSHDPGTWSKQAKLARDGEWNTLKKLQEELDGGK